MIVAEFYDAAVSGGDSIAERPGFKAMLDRIAGNGVRCIIVESPDRFARDRTVQLTGHDFLKSLGIVGIRRAFTTQPIQASINRSFCDRSHRPLAFVPIPWPVAIGAGTSIVIKPNQRRIS